MAATFLTAERARELSSILATAYPASGDPDAAEDLSEALTYASAVTGSLTCRSLVDGQPGEAVPSWMTSIAERAVVMKAEQGYVRGGTAEARRSAIGGGNLQSFTAGPYSESYFGPDQASKAKMLDPDPSTHEALWALATEECRQGWLDLWADRPAPAAAASSYEFGNRPGGYFPVPGDREYL